MSEKDKGQSDAINKGFELATGDIVGWQNSDDIYNPGAFHKVVKYFSKYPTCDLIFTDFYLIDKKDTVIQEIRLRPFNKWEYLYQSPNITNQSAFFRRDLITKTGLMNPKYNYGMDFDIFVRASNNGKFKHVKEFFGNLRVHDNSKTVSSGVGIQWQQEYADIRKTYGIQTDPNCPWKAQYRFKKFYFKLRRLFYYFMNGNIDYLWKKLQKDSLVSSWNTKKVAISEKKNIAIVHPALSLGGATAVAVWSIEALKEDYNLTLITTETVNIQELNDFFGTNLCEGDFQVRVVPFFCRKLLPNAFLFKVHLLQRYYKRHRSEFDLALGTRCEMDFGEPGIQYIHMPVWNEDELRQIGHMPNAWIHKKTFLRRIYKYSCGFLSGWSEERMKQNITLTNSNWTNRKVKRAYDIESQVIYPPVLTGFPDWRWEDREDGFICIGSVAPEKQIEKIIEIIQQVRVTNPNIHLHIIGNSSNTECEKKIDHLCAQRSDWLFWEKNLTRNQLKTLVAKHKYGIHGMRHEHFGIVVAEMAKAGCIPFIPEGGGQEEIVRDKRLIYETVEDSVRKIVAVLTNLSGQKLIREHLHQQCQMFSEKVFIKAIKTETIKFFLN